VAGKSGKETEAEIERLRAENKRLRSQLGITVPSKGAPSTQDDSEPKPSCVILVPQPPTGEKQGKLGPVAFGNVVRTTVDTMAERRPDVHWAAEQDLDRIPKNATVFELSEILPRFFGDGPVPKTFMVGENAEGERMLRRRIVDGEPESHEFLAGHEHLIASFDELAAEGEAATAAGADSHAAWVLAAMDLVIARLKHSRAFFEIGIDDWRRIVNEPRPEYDPRSVP
jgi:hypothetical protein